MSLKRENKPIKLSFAESNSQSNGKFFGCGAGRARIAVDIDGTVYGCAKLATANKDGTGVLPLGNVIDDFPIGDTISRSGLFSRAKWMNEKCPSCGAFGKCHGGCPAANFTATGSPYLHPECECDLTFATMRTKSRIMTMLDQAGLKAEG